jgi:hypothetical protein
MGFVAGMISLPEVEKGEQLSIQMSEVQGESDVLMLLHPRRAFNNKCGRPPPTRNVNRSFFFPFLE